MRSLNHDPEETHWRKETHCWRIGQTQYRNLYIGAHMSEDGIAFLPASELARLLQPQQQHRYRFVFLDGCESGKSPLLAGLFGFDPNEVNQGTGITCYHGTTGSPRKRPGGG
jgi:hypothetical protein